MLPPAFVPVFAGRLGSGAPQAVRAALPRRLRGSDTTVAAAQRVHQWADMWVDNAQRDRIFEMIGTHSATHHPAHSSRLDHQWTVLAAIVVGGAGLWIALLVF